MATQGAARGAFGAILALALILSACSSSPSRNAGQEPTSPTPGAPSSPSSCADELSGTVSDHGTKTATGSSIEVEAGDFFFAPTCITASGLVTVTVRNTGQTLHNISITAQNIDKDVQIGKTVTVTLQVSASTVPFFCKYHTAQGMQGAVTSA